MFLIDEIIQEIIRYNEIWHARFHFFSIKVNELNKQWIPCKFGNIMLDLLMKSLNYCRNPTLAKCGGEAQHLEKSEELESSGTPECSELDSKAQNTSHWGVLGVIEKVLKRRYRKWPRIGHLDICLPSYGQKKGRESNWQFDSRPLKVKNRPLSDLRMESATWRWKDLDEGYKFGSDLVVIRPGSREL
jgi:hypothetical protein